MKIAFYCPLKPISHPNPSGDREIARGLHSFLSSRAEVFVLSEFRTRLFYRDPAAIARWLNELVQAYRLAKKEKPDLYFTYHLYYKAPDPIGFLLAWWFKKPYFVFEGMYARKKSRRLGYWAGYFLTKFALRYATRVFSDKTEDFEFLEKWFPGKAIYLPPSINLESFQMKSGERSAVRRELGLGEEPAIVTVAMLRPDRKSEGVEFLLRCLGRLVREGLVFRWLHIGGGVCAERVKALCARELGDRGVMLGPLDSGGVARVLGAADFFAFPGIDESFGLVYVEAQAAGLPVIAFKNGGIPDAVEEGKTAFLTPLLDEEAYCDALRILIRQGQTRAKMGAEAKEFVAGKFSRSRNYEKLMKVLEA